MLEINKKNIRIWSMLGMRRVLGMMLSELARTDSRFIFVTADVARYFGTEGFEEQFSDRYIDVGIAEQNMVTVAAGLQKEGMNALAATYATFITARTMDQLRVSLGYMGLPVLLIGVGAGLAEGDLSATHMGLEDVAMLRSIPNIRIIEPADCTEFVKVLYATRAHDAPTYIRLTGKTNLPRVYTDDYDYKIGKAVKLNDGDGRCAIITAGTITDSALRAAILLKENNGPAVSVYNMHTIKPIDTQLLDEIAGHKFIVVVEEHMRIGGLGSAICEYYMDRKVKPQIIVLGIDDFYPQANDYENLLQECGLTAECIADKIKMLMR